MCACVRACARACFACAQVALLIAPLIFADKDIGVTTADGLAPRPPANEAVLWYAAPPPPAAQHDAIRRHATPSLGCTVSTLHNGMQYKKVYNQII